MTTKTKALLLNVPAELKAEIEKLPAGKRTQFIVSAIEAAISAAQSPEAIADRIRAEITALEALAKKQSD